MESRRYDGGTVTHRHVLYLGELNDSQREAWQRALEVALVQKRHGQARRVWVMDRGIPTEEVLAEMRAATPPVHYLADTEPDTLWRYYMQLTAVEEGFRTLKGDLELQPIYRQKPERIEAHLFVAFLAYCLSTTLRQQLRGLAGGLMPRTVLEKLAGLMMLDASLPTVDGRELVLARRTEPEADVQLLLEQLGLALPDQPPPRIRADAAKAR